MAPITQDTMEWMATSEQIYRAKKTSFGFHKQTSAATRVHPMHPDRTNASCTTARKQGLMHKEACTAPNTGIQKGECNYEKGRAQNRPAASKTSYTRCACHSTHVLAERQKHNHMHTNTCTCASDGLHAHMYKTFFTHTWRGRSRILNNPFHSQKNLPPERKS